MTTPRRKPSFWDNGAGAIGCVTLVGAAAALIGRWFTRWYDGGKP